MTRKRRERGSKVREWSEMGERGEKVERGKKMKKRKMRQRRGKGAGKEREVRANDRRRGCRERA